MSYRATPLQATGVTPSQLMLGRQIHTTVPTLESKLQPAWPDLQQVRQTDEKVKQSYKRAYDNRHDERVLPVLEPGNSVAVKLDNERGWTKTTTVL
ncbi:hypothetical protein JOB18_009561 [Solea senegalensis]|uniref:Uncharacterized protein n=1 Tax=Solea senegalensis TaxID=28829 RepID=A0AAV6Q789_SOLSE|nr:hypothetical protein JOB18_009561 [Solea senegalensis]